MKSTFLSLLLFSIAVSAIPPPTKCTPPSLVPLNKCIGGSFKICAKGLLPLPTEPARANECIAKRHRLMGCITNCYDSPRIAVPTCPPYICDKPTIPPAPSPTGKDCYDACYAASSCVSDPPLEACKCNNGIIANCSLQCGLPIPPIPPCIEQPKPTETPGPTCYEKCRAGIECPTEPFPAACDCNNRAIATCSVECDLPLPPLPPCPDEEPASEPSEPALVPRDTDEIGVNCRAICKQSYACPMAWPMSCYCELGHRRACAECFGWPWDEEKESAACEGDVI